jgi:hypothetical protein
MATSTVPTQADSELPLIALGEYFLSVCLTWTNRAAKQKSGPWWSAVTNDVPLD